MSSESEGIAHFPPGSAAPQASRRDLRDPAHLAKLNAGKAAWYALPKEERARITAERKATKEARRAEREAKKAARVGGGAPSPATTPTPPLGAHPSEPPATQRSQRAPVHPAQTLAEPPPDFDDVPARPRATAGPLQGLLDLCAAMPVSFGNDGVSFIQVTRLKPTTAFNIPCAGVQKQLWEPIDDAEFTLRYGGSEYSLRGYQLRPDGRPKALTEAVIYRVAGAPNLDSILTEEDTMRPNPGNGHSTHPAFRRPGVMAPQVASAEAQMHDRQLTHEERRESERREERLRQRREETDRAERQAEREVTMAELVNKTKDKEIDRLSEAHRQQLELVQAHSRGGFAEVAELLKVVRPGEDSQALVRQHAAELREAGERHREEMLRLTQSHREEIRRLTEAHTAAVHRLEDQARHERTAAEERCRETERRAAEQIKETERWAAEQIKEADRRADARLADFQSQSRISYEDLKARSEERLSDQRNQYELRLTDLRENHARELRTKEGEINLMRQNLEGNQAVILQQKDAEIKRLRDDLREAKELAEKNKDWLGRMQEFQETAEALGFEKNEGGGEADEDLKTMAGKAALGALTRLPELVAAGADAVSKLRNPGLPPDVARSQARSGMVRGSMRTPAHAAARSLPTPGQMPLPFASEDVLIAPPPDAEPPRPWSPPPPLEPQPLPFEQALVTSPPPTSAAVAAPAEGQPALPAAPATVAGADAAPASSGAPAAPSKPPQPPEPSASAAPNPSAAPPIPPAAGIDPIAIPIIEQLAPLLASLFEQKAPPQAVADALIQQNTPDMVRFATSQMSIDQLVHYLKQSPGAHAPLVTRNGEKFLREVWRNAVEAVSRSPGAP